MQAITRIASVIAVGAVLTAAAVAGAAPTGTGYAIPRHAIANGGARSSSATYVLTGTIAEPEAQQRLAGGSYALRGGFRAAVPQAAPDSIFGNGFE